MKGLSTRRRNYHTWAWTGSRARSSSAELMALSLSDPKKARVQDCHSRLSNRVWGGLNRLRYSLEPRKCSTFRPARTRWTLLSHWRRATMYTKAYVMLLQPSHESTQWLIVSSVLMLQMGPQIASLMFTEDNELHVSLSFDFRNIASCLVSSLGTTISPSWKADTCGATILSNSYNNLSLSSISRFSSETRTRSLSTIGNNGDVVRPSASSHFELLIKISIFSIDCFVARVNSGDATVKLKSSTLGYSRENSRTSENDNLKSQMRMHFPINRVKTIVLTNHMETRQYTLDDTILWMKTCSFDLSVVFI